MCTRVSKGNNSYLRKNVLKSVNTWMKKVKFYPIFTKNGLFLRTFFVNKTSIMLHPY